MNISEVKKVINNNTKNNEKSFIWDSINLAVYPLQFVCSEKMNKRVNNIINKLAIEDMPNFLNTDISINYELFYYMIQGHVIMMKDNLRSYMSINPNIIKDALIISLKIYEHILLFNKYRRHVNDRINSLILNLHTITNNELNKLNVVYHR